jgi:hypothetical protein
VRAVVALLLLAGCDDEGSRDLAWPDCSAVTCPNFDVCVQGNQYCRCAGGQAIICSDCPFACPTEDMAVSFVDLSESCARIFAAGYSCFAGGGTLAACFGASPRGEQAASLANCFYESVQTSCSVHCRSDGGTASSVMCVDCVEGNCGSDGGAVHCTGGACSDEATACFND